MTKRTKKTRKRKITSNSAATPQHPFTGPRHPRFVRLILIFACAACVCAGASITAAQSDTPQQPPIDKKTLALMQSCLLYGNVFTADGHLLYGAEVHVTRDGDKHPKWEAASDRRGEFAIRVPPGADYVVQVKSKGFVTQTQKVTANASTRVDMVFHMDPGSDKKK
jgi:Carboxypeptidase regulatory-like domain